MASDPEKEKSARKLRHCRVLLLTGTYPKGLNKNEKRMLRCLKEKFMVDSSGKLVTIEGNREVVIEQKEQEEIVKKVHEGQGGAHLGRDKTVQELAAKFYWKGISNDVIQCINKCSKCVQHKKPIRARAKSSVVEKEVLDQAEKPTAPLHSIPVSGTWELVGIDVVGPLPTTENGNKYLITLCDLFSRWPEAAAVPDKSADSVAKFLMEVMMRMGFVKVITNQDGEFVNLVNAKLSKKCGVQLSIVKECHFQANRMVKRFSDTLETTLSKVVNKDRNDWDDHVNSILFAYRTSVHATTKLSPFVVMFGREAVLPIDLMHSSSQPSAQPTEPESYEKFVETMKKERKRIHERLMENVEQAQTRRKKHKDKNLD